MASVATLSYIERASELLSTSAPTVSAKLQHSRRTLAEATGKEAPEHMLTCNACGHALIPGWTCASKPQTNSKRTRQDRLAKLQSTKTVSLECSKCQSINTLDAPKPKPSKRLEANPPESSTVKPSKLDSQPPSEVSRTQPIATQAKPSDSPAEPASKKRNRNKKSSLQSMLAGKKPPALKGGFGLDLMDFMKT